MGGKYNKRVKIFLGLILVFAISFAVFSSAEQSIFDLAKAGQQGGVGISSLGDWFSQTCKCGDWKNVACGAEFCPKNYMLQKRDCSPSKCDLTKRCVKDSKCSQPECKCSNWQSVRCGGGQCASNQMLQIRACTPFGCNKTEQCSADTKCQVPKKCFSNGECNLGEFCKKATGACLYSFVPVSGVCAKTPGTCDTIYNPVCGCDGKTYSNECMAFAAKANVKYKGKCNQLL